MHEKFRDQNFSETRKGSPAKFFGIVRQKELRQNRDTPFIQKKFDTRTFLKHREGLPTKVFCTVRQKIFDGKS